MWVLLYGTIGLVCSTIISLVLTWINPSRFLFENDIVGYGPILLSIGANLIGLLVGIGLGIRKQRAKDEENGKGTGSLIFSSIAGILVLSLVVAPSINIFFNPLMLLTYSIGMWKNKKQKASAQEKISANNNLTLGIGDSAAGIGFRQEIKKIAAEPNDNSFLIIGDIERGITMGTDQLGPIVKINFDGSIDLTFGEQITASISKVIGKHVPFTDALGISNTNEISYLGNTNNKLFFTILSKVFTVEATGKLENRINIRGDLDGVRVVETKLSPDKNSLFVTKILGLYRAAPEGSTPIEKYRTSDGELDTNFKFDSGFRDTKGVLMTPSYLQIFNNGNVFLVYQTEQNFNNLPQKNSTKLLLLSPTGSVLWEKTPTISYLPSDVVRAGPNKIIVNYKTSRGDPDKSYFIAGDSEVSPSDFKNFEKEEVSSQRFQEPDCSKPIFWDNKKDSFKIDGRINCEWKMPDGGKIFAGNFVATSKDETYINIAHITPNETLDENFLKKRNIAQAVENTTPPPSVADANSVSDTIQVKPMIESNRVVGLLIQSIQPISPLNALGFKIGDLLFMADNKPLLSALDLKNVLDADYAQTIRLLRNGTEITISTK